MSPPGRGTPGGCPQVETILFPPGLLTGRANGGQETALNQGCAQYGQAQGLPLHDQSASALVRAPCGCPPAPEVRRTWFSVAASVGPGAAACIASEQRQTPHERTPHLPPPQRTRDILHRVVIAGDSSCPASRSPNAGQLSLPPAKQRHRPSNHILQPLDRQQASPLAPAGHCFLFLCAAPLSEDGPGWLSSCGLR